MNAFFSFHQRVAVTSMSGAHVRYVHRALASAMVTGGSARVDAFGTGRIRAVTLNRPSTAFAERIGNSSPPLLGGVKFTRWRRLDDSGTRVIEFHPRSFW